MHNLAAIYSLQSRLSEAEVLYNKALTIKRRQLSGKYPDTLITVNSLAALYTDQGRHQEAEQLYLVAVNTRQRILGKQHPESIQAAKLLIELYETWQKLEPAKAWRASLFHEIIKREIDVIPEEYLAVPQEFQACAIHLQEISAALARYREDNGTLPDWLSDLVPTYLERENLLCPNDTKHTSEYYPDPKPPCSYSWELSLENTSANWQPGGKRD